MRPRGTPRARPDARARAGPRSRANIFISSAEQADPAAVGRRHAARSRAPAVATTARRGATPLARPAAAFARSDAPPTSARGVAPRTAREANIQRGTRSENLGRAGARSHALDAEGDAGAPGAGARVRRRAVSLSGVGDDARGWCARGARDPRTPRSRVQRTRWVFAVATARRRFRATHCGGDAPARDQIRDDAATAVTERRFSRQNALCAAKKNGFVCFLATRVSTRIAPRSEPSPGQERWTTYQHVRDTLKETHAYVTHPSPSSSTLFFRGASPA